MPFLDGVPCSIHGVCFPDGVAALRPVEMVTLPPRGADSRDPVRVWRHVDALGSTGCRPCEPCRDVRGELRRGWATRSASRRVLRRLATHRRRIPAHRAQPALLRRPERDRQGLARLPVAADARCAGQWLRHGADRRPVRGDARRVGRRASLGRRRLFLRSLHPAETDQRAIILSGDDVRLHAGVDEQPHGELMLAVGGVPHWLPEPHADRVLPGRSIAPMVASAFALADQTWGTAIGPLEPARDIRPVRLTT